MRTETVVIGEEFGKEYAGKYVFQELTWAKRSRIIQKYTKYNPLTGQLQSSDDVAIQAEMIVASLKEQPQHKPITLERLLAEDPEKGIPIALGELFGRIVNRLNMVNFDEAAFLSGVSDATSRIKHSQTSDSVKNLGGRRNS